ncbi:MAG: hypothetical protein NT105_03820 [Verrucomicrobia bacterium]|nr:hypothetical protein [Verrucomicrobiota bacterium]
MPFNANIPVNDTLGNADPIRENFNALKQQIDAAPTAEQVAESINNAVADKPTNDAMNSAISGAINGTPRNVDGFSQLYYAISDPPTQSEVQQLLDSYNALILALRRNV